MVRATVNDSYHRGATFKVSSSSESHWLQPMLVFTVRWWPAPICVGGLLVISCDWFGVDFPGLVIYAYRAFQASLRLQENFEPPLLCIINYNNLHKGHFTYKPRAQRKGSTCRPNTPPKPWSVVTYPQV